MRRRLLALLALAGCVLPAGAAEPSKPARPWELRTYGALRAIFHEGALDAAVQLQALLPDERLYAVGALSGLRGEVTIVAGVPYASYPAGAASRTESPPARPESACLLVASRVREWKQARIEREVGFADLDEAVAALAAAAGLDTNEAFPFVIEAPLRDLAWHVIDGARLAEGAASHADHQAAAVQHRADEVRATLLGFYSPRDHGVFTHIGSNTHVHAVLDDPPSTGHVDHVTLPAGTVIRLPVR